MISIHETGLTEIRADQLKIGDKLDTAPESAKIVRIERQYHLSWVIVVFCRTASGATKIRTYDETDIVGVIA